MKVPEYHTSEVAWIILTRMIKGLQKRLNAFSSSKDKEGKHGTVFRKEGNNLFLISPVNLKRTHGLKIHQGRVCLNIRRIIL